MRGLAVNQTLMKQGGEKSWIYIIETWGDFCYHSNSSESSQGIETQNTENRNTTYTTTKKEILTQNVKINVVLIKKIMTEKMTT